MNIEDYLLAAAVFTSQSLATVRFCVDFRRGLLPRAVDFAAVSCLLFLGIPLMLECLGMPYESRFFVSLFQADDLTRWGVAVLAASAPWLIRLGNRNPNRARISRVAVRDYSLKPNIAPVFYIIVLTTSAWLAYCGYSLVSRGDNVWDLRRHVGDTWGAGIVALYLPMHFLAFFIMTADSRSHVGRVVIALLTVAAMMSSLAVGERTNLLLPLAMLCVFWFRTNVVTLILSVMGLLLCAAIVLPWFKWQHSAREQSVGEKVATIVGGDLARTPVMASALEMSEPIGTNIMPYPGAGYAYGMLFFVPRSWVPAKGYSTAAGFTTHIVGGRPEEITWGFGLGLTEELMLNFGWMVCLPGLLLWGAALGWMDRFARRIPALSIPSSLAAVWSSGYHIPALLLTFGAMAGVSIALHVVFARRHVARGTAPYFLHAGGGFHACLDRSSVCQ